MDAVLFGHLVEMGHEVGEELLDHGVGLGLLPLGVTVGVEVAEEEGAHLEHGFADEGRHLDISRPRAARHDVADHGLDALRRARAERGPWPGGQVLLGQQPCALGVVYVVADVGDAVGEGDDAALGCGRPERAGVAADAVDDLACEVEARPVPLKELDDSRALLVVREEPAGLGSIGVEAAPAGDCVAERSLAHVPEGGVAEVVAERYGLGKVLVEPEGTGNGARHLGYLEGVDEARAIVVPLGGEKNLGLVGEPSEALGVEDAVAVALEAGPESVRLLGDEPAHRGARERGVRGKPLAFEALEVLPR